MKKIPLETTLGGAYRFLFMRIISIVGTVWLPILLFAGLVVGLMCLVVPHDWLSGHWPVVSLDHFEAKDVAWEKILPLLYIWPVIAVAALIMVSMITVGLMRHALDPERKTTFIFFSLGAPVWRMLAAFLLSGVLIAVAAIVANLVVMLVTRIAVPMVPPPAAEATAVVLGIMVAVFIIYVSFRLVFFLPAVVVAENRIGLGRSWELGGGNVWRIFFVLLLIVIPVAFVAGVVLEITVLPVVVAEAMKLPHDPQLSDVLAFVRGLIPLLWVVVPTVIIMRIASLSLLAGAAGTAYNAVTASAAGTAPSAGAAPSIGAPPAGEATST
ncbi:MAG: glycerophosphoryl diester phosphodiesterase membrane domain-containing protein [Alphaproteobacteria bacterium]|nr:glycerophosphoryl diester phosphodiesterase membrane domain-containing protein [Alphaproteobacteria bacterium]